MTETSVPVGLDHLLFAASSLEKGMDEVEALLGTRPVRGGRHPAFGTHNALLSLGNTCYLEVIAADPGLPVPARGRLVNLDSDTPSRLITWVARREKLDSAVADHPVLGTVQAGERRTADGSTIRWRLSDPYADRMSGALPFFISWGETPHPANAAPTGGRLSGLSIGHPQADRLRTHLAAMNLDVSVRSAASFCIEAQIDTDRGICELR